MTPTAEQALEALNEMESMLQFDWPVVQKSKRLSDAIRQHIEATAAEVEALRRELANERASGIHTCGPDCTRSGCVNARLRAEVEALRGVLHAVYDELDKGGVDAPGHCHSSPGVWDSDNRAPLAGSRCKWCATWGVVRAALNQGGAG